MAGEGFEAFHFPQQSRRDHLRVMNFLTNPPQPQLSLFTPSTMPTHQPPLSLHFSDHYHYSEGGEFRSSVPLGPFTGYASILKTSRFLTPAQQLLQDFCGSDRSDSNPPHLLNYFSEAGRDQTSTGVSDRVELQFKNSRLTIMLEEVYKKYKLYCQQMESVVASFESIDGVGNAAPYISFAIKAISKHFGCLKNAILDKLQSKGKSTVGDLNLVKDEVRKVSKRGLHSQNLSHENLTNKLHLSEIRSQRGLPENAVAVMRTWLFEHFLHPYSSDSKKQMLAQQTGLSRTQVSNWFINSRVRLWKPMVEEIHGLETQQAPMLSVSDATSRNTRMPSLHSSSSEKPLHLGTLPQTKRSKTNKYSDTSKQNETQSNAAAYESSTRYYLRMNTGSHEGEVSLALSLQGLK